MGTSLAFSAVLALGGALALVRTGARLRPTERLAAGFTLGLTAAHALAYVLAVSLGPARGATVLVAVAAAVVTAAALTDRAGVRQLAADARSILAALRGDREARRAAVGLGTLALIAASIFSRQYLDPEPDGIYSDGNTWIDATQHAAIASYFRDSGRIAWLPENPLFDGAHLAYHFLPDLLAGTLSALGLPLRGVFIGTGLPAVLAVATLAFHLARRLLGTRRGAFLTVALAFLSGGLGFTLAARRLATAGFDDALWYDATYEPERALHAGNLLVTLLVPARCSAFGMASGLAALLLLIEGRERGLDRRALVVAGLLYGALPLVHVHSFMAVGPVALGWAVGARSWRWGWFFGSAGLVALPQLAAILLSMDSGPGYVRYHPGWMAHGSGALGFLEFWLRNRGLAFALAPAAWLAAPRALRARVWPLLLLFPVANLVAFGPVVYDNSKLLAWTFLGVALLEASLLTGLARRGRVGLATVLVALLTLSGALSVTSALTREQGRFLAREDVAFARLVRRVTEPDALFATATASHHPVPTLSGRRALCANGWILGTDALDWAPRAEEQRLIYRGGRRARAVLDRYDVDYVVVGPREREEFKPIDEAFLGSVSDQVVRAPGYTLYRINPRALGN